MRMEAEAGNRVSEMEQRIAAYLAHRQPEAGGFVVGDLARIHGGSSQETYRFRATWQEGGVTRERQLILRRAPPKGLVNAAADVEFDVYSALGPTGVPVPGVHYMELDPAWLDRSFFIMDLVPGDPGHFFGGGDPYGEASATVGRNFWHHLGTLARQDHRALGLTFLRNGEAAGGFWQAELAHWERKLDEGEAAVEPIVRGAIRWLRRNPPPEAAKPAIVHGDYRNGNFLFLPDGTISAVLDWEMVHVGDPLEDMAWALDPMWSFERYFPLEEGLAVWEAASGLRVDRAALDWWRVFVAVKSCAIWTTAEASFQDGINKEMIIALTALRASHFHRKVLLERMAERGAMG